MITVPSRRVNHFPIGEHLFTALIAIPCASALLLLMYRLSKLSVRASTQLNVHCIAWICYFITGFIHALYVLVKWKSVDALLNEHIFQITIVFHLCFMFLLPWTVLVATVDRCISLRFPTYYSLFNGETIRMITVIVSICMICLSWHLIHFLVIRIDSGGACYMVECFDITHFIRWFIVYKVVFGFTNLFISSIFIYLFWNYQRRGRGLDKIKNTLMFIILISEFLFNVLPPLAYYFINLFGELELIHIFGPLVFISINLDGICTVLVYIATYKRKRRHFQQCKPQQNFSAQSKPIKSIQLAQRIPPRQEDPQPRLSRAISK